MSIATTGRMSGFCRVCGLLIESERVVADSENRADAMAASLGISAFLHFMTQHSGGVSRIAEIAATMQAWLGLDVVHGSEWERPASAMLTGRGDDVAMARERLQFSLVQVLLRGGPGGWHDAHRTAAPSLGALEFADDWVTAGWSRAGGHWVELGASRGVTVTSDSPPVAPEMGVHDIADFLNGLEGAVASRVNDYAQEAKSPSARCHACGPARLALMERILELEKEKAERG